MMIIISRIIKFIVLASVFSLGLKNIVKDEITKNKYILLWIISLLLQLQNFMRFM